MGQVADQARDRLREPGRAGSTRCRRGRPPRCRRCPAAGTHGSLAAGTDWGLPTRAGRGAAGRPGRMWRRLRWDPWEGGRRRHRGREGRVAGRLRRQARWSAAPMRGSRGGPGRRGRHRWSRRRVEEVTRRRRWLRISTGHRRSGHGRTGHGGAGHRGSGHGRARPCAGGRGALPASGVCLSRLAGLVPVRLRRRSAQRRRTRRSIA